MNKICPLCGINECNKKKSGKLESYCKACQSEYHKQYRKKNKDALKVKQQQYLENNKEEINKRRKCFRDNNKGHLSEKDRIYRRKNKESLREKKRAYSIANKEHENKRKREWALKKQAECGVFVLIRKLRSNIKDCFDRMGYAKRSRTREIVGLDFETLKNYLEYTWFRNYGTEYAGEKIHIDHIVPVSTAKTEEDVIRLNHYTNLQYLTPEDNLRKSDEYHV
jgi:hypothetical protein